MDEPLIFIAGPCVIEDAHTVLETAKRLREITAELPVQFVFKASFDKANRTSVDSFRGPGIEQGLEILDRVRQEADVPVLSDVHEPGQAFEAAEVLDVLQIPAFLIRQTDLVVAAAETGKPLNLKKAQFMAPEDMQHVTAKAESVGNSNLWLTERGTSFGYHNLVVDFRSLSILGELGYPVIFDATHSVQIPSKGGTSSGNREYVRPLARAAAAYGINGLFCETHPNPDAALSDGANMLPLDEIPALLDEILAIRAALATQAPPSP